MLLTRLGVFTSSLCKISRPTNLLLQKSFKNKMKEEDELNDKPIPYSKSEAAKWKAIYNREAPTDQVWYTPIVVSASIGVFLLYFCILREENDLDQILYRPLPETIKGIESTYPGFDFYKKPDYVVYHEEQAQKIKKENK